MIASNLLHRCSRLALRMLLMGTLQLSGMALAQAPETDGPPVAEPSAAAVVVAAPIQPALREMVPEARLDSGNTAWMLMSSVLVLFMTLPGIALFYGGMVRKKNVLSMGAQVFVCAVLVTVSWTLLGYSLALRPGSTFIGGLDRMLLNGLTADSLSGSDGANIPESVFWMFQLTFAIITTALIPGAMAERMKFSSLCWFAVLWSLLVYAPIAHWVWEPGGWLATMGALDFAGGTVVHVNAGVAGLVCALVMGRRRGFGREPMSPHNLVLTMIGAGMLWVGWFGFNAGSALAANGTAGMAMLVTQIATAFAALAWMCIEWTIRGRPSALGIVSGAVAGLVAITPAAGFVDPVEAGLIGSISGVVCYLGATSLKRRFGYDDSLDVFGIHGIGGAVGAVLTGVYGVAETSQIGVQVATQLVAIGAAALYSAVGTFVILVIINSLMGLRVDDEAEREGLDRMEHGEHIE
ncbi:MAG TPA: ammonium transporter [Rhodocyclaceae bacterium]|nr:ammonium transporter [Rhodocyclaceae bacterium]